MIAQPPRSTPFPHPTLFGSREGPGARVGAPRLDAPDGQQQPRRGAVLALRRLDRLAAHRARVGRRSEEHTSELQSRQYIVCRLLLEKKKTRILLTDYTIVTD